MPVWPWYFAGSGAPSTPAVAHAQPSTPVLKTLTPSSLPPYSATLLCAKLVIWPNFRFTGAAPDTRVYVHGSSKSMKNGEPRIGMISRGSPRSSYPTSIRYLPELGTE